MNTMLVSSLHCIFETRMEWIRRSPNVSLLMNLLAYIYADIALMDEAAYIYAL